MQYLVKCLSLVLLLAIQLSLAEDAPIILNVKNKIINVDGRTKQVYTIEQPNGTWGIYATKGQNFNVIVKNQTQVPTVIHWHGLLLPNDQDGVPYVTQAPIPPGGEYHYNFPLLQSGTYWMHSHMGLQIQDLMVAPLIIADPNDPYKSAQQVVIVFQDFTFKNPEAILKMLHAGMPTSKNMHAKMKIAQGPDLNDVDYDAFLTNYHTLKNPQITTVKPNSIVRLRFINAGSGSNFWIHLGKLKGTAIAFDGKNIKPFSDNMFQLALGQRIDILVNIPKTGGVFPILGQVEGTDRQTGLVLVTSNIKIPTFSENAATIDPPLNYQQELQMKSLNPLPEKPIAKIVKLTLTGNMDHYIWKINNQVWPNVDPIKLKLGQRVELIFDNQSNMAHPMHLHGNVFELVGLDQKKITDGALHDTILVLPHTQVKVIFDVAGTGKWVLHCHMAYHMSSGMMTIVAVSK